jgi:hypothetical protein
MWYPLMEMGLYLGAFFEAHSNMSSMSRRAGSGGNTQACCAWYSLRMSFCTVPRSLWNGTPCRSAAIM